jgi:hypothetical protein
MGNEQDGSASDHKPDHGGEQGGKSPRSGRPPPEGSRWKKGQSGNPKGRPKGTGLTDSLKRLARGQHNGRPIADLLAESMLKHALSGKYQHAKEIWDRLEGRPADNLNAKVAVTKAVFHVPPPRVLGETDGLYQARVSFENLASEFKNRLEGTGDEGAG